MTYQVQTHPEIIGADYKPRGGAEQFIYCHDPEVIIHGPAETGKTLAACWLLHLTALKYAGAQLSIVRKTQKSVYGSVLATFERVIAGAPVRPYGGQKPEKYIYPNGSLIWVGGLDNPDKVLSSERDIIYCNQAEELALDDWEKMITRTTGRSAIIPHPRLIGDANPAGARHWIRSRQSLTLIQSRHIDNPTLYNDDGALTEQGKRTIARLSNLTGIRRKRLYEGIWATAEGAVFDMFDRDIHVRERSDAEFVRWGLGVDYGYTHPAVILLIGIDLDGRWHIAREWYERGRLQSAIVEQARAWYIEKECGTIAVDEAAAGLIADMNDAGIPSIGAKGRVLNRIAAIQDRLKVQGDELPRLTVDPACVNTINEFESYVWKPEKDEPVKENDHAMDALGYFHEAGDYDPTQLAAYV